MNSNYLNGLMAEPNNYLIKQGAKLTETVNGIVEEIGALVNHELEDQSNIMSDNHLINMLTSKQQLLLAKMVYAPITIDSLVSSTGLTADSVSSMLLLMELNGTVESRHGGKYYRCLQIQDIYERISAGCINLFI